MPPIPGVAGVDFPVLTEIPQTGFDCAAQDFPGIYADMDTDCQVSRMTLLTRTKSLEGWIR